MADDAPFTTQPPQPLAPEAPPAPAPGDPQAAARVLHEAIRGAVAPLAQRFEQRIDSLEQRMAQPPTPAPAPPGQGDWIDKVADRDQLRGEVMGWVREAVGPALLPIAESTQEIAERNQVTRVSEEYGAEFWEEHVEPRYRAIMGELRQTNPIATISPRHIETVVSSILGGRELAREAAQARARVEQTRAAERTRAPRFVGPGRPQLPSDDAVSDEDRNIISRIQRSLGKDAFTEKDLIEGRKARGGGEEAA